MAQIQLNEKERLLFDTLLKASSKIEKKPTLRCAGGWVRDKLLGKESVDVDITLDNMYGKEFGEHVNEYLKEQNEKIHRMAVIQSNPDKSKHLETARLIIMDYEIDLVHLRSEKYTDTSRIPEIDIGTPLEDALRRDFTINSLFYNLNTNQVEDFTEKGLQDLKDGIIRTPIDAKQTFTDDPLRVLRAVRFGSRFEFDYHEDIVKAVQLQEVQEALQKKISRERIGQEVKKMVQGPQPYLSLETIFKFDLFTAIFQPPPQLEKEMDQKQYIQNCRKTLEIASQIYEHRQSEASKLSKEMQEALFCAALLLPVRFLEYQEKKKRVNQMIYYVAMNSLKREHKFAKNVAYILKGVDQFMEAWILYKEKTAENQNSEDEFTTDQQIRVALGKVIAELPEQWLVGVILFPILLQSYSTYPAINETQVKFQDLAKKLNYDIDKEVIVSQQLSQELLDLVKQYNLEQIVEQGIKPILNGDQVKQLLGLPGGPQMSKAMTLVKEWQLANPSNGQEECKEWLQVKYRKLSDGKDPIMNPVL